MLDPEVRRETVERLGAGVDRIQPDQVLPDGELHPETIPFVEALWEQWVATTLYMIAFGFTHRSLCDAAGEIAAVKDEAGKRILTATSS